MSANKLRLFFIAGLLILGGCASTPKQKIIQNMVIAGVIGAAVGYQKSEYKNTHALMYGGLAASGAGIVSAYYSDLDSDSAKMRDENLRLKSELDELQAPMILAAAPATFSGKIPDRYRKLVNPGEWTVADIDQWIDDGENRLIHQDKIMELIPPSLRPVQNLKKKDLRSASY